MLLERPTTWLCLALALSAGAGSIKPAFKWAQSPSDIHIYAKFAHKIDAPAYNNFQKSNVKVEINEKSISMIASNDEKQFQLDLELFKPIIPEESTYSVHTFGVSLVLKKKDKVWKRLLKDKNMKPRNMHLWWELYDKYNDEMERLMDNEKDSKSSKKEKKWWKRFEHKCGACREMMTRAAFTQKAMWSFKKALDEEKRENEEKRKGEDEKSEATKRENSTDIQIDQLPDASNSTDTKMASLKIATSLVKKVCESYDVSEIKPDFKRACKKLRKKRDVKHELIFTIAAVVEMKRTRPDLTVEQVVSAFLANQTEKACAVAAGVCNSVNIKMTPCKACHAVVDSIYAFTAAKQMPPADHVVIDNACQRAIKPYSNVEEAEWVVSSTCRALVMRYDTQILKAVRGKNSRKALNTVCREAGFCKKKKKQKIVQEKPTKVSDSKSEDDAKDSTVTTPSETVEEASPAVTDTVADEL